MNRWKRKSVFQSKSKEWARVKLCYQRTKLSKAQQKATLFKRSLEHEMDFSIHKKHTRCNDSGQQNIIYFLNKFFVKMIVKRLTVTSQHNPSKFCMKAFSTFEYTLYVLKTTDHQCLLQRCREKKKSQRTLWHAGYTRRGL